MKKTIIDLLNKIANDEQPPKKIIFRDDIYEYDECGEDYYNEEYGWIFDEYDLISILNEPIEILETTITYKPDKIEYLNIEKDRYNAEKISCKINEIIEVLNER